MATYCHGKPLLAVPKAQKASSSLTSENKRTPELISDSGSDKQVADWIGSPLPTRWIRPFVGLSWSDEISKSFLSYPLLKVYTRSSPDCPCLPLRAVKWAGLGGSSPQFCLKPFWHLIALRTSWKDHDSLCSSILNRTGSIQLSWLVDKSILV